MRLDNQKIYNTYKNSVLSEAKVGMRRKAQILEDKIDDFFDEIESKISSLQETPVFQTKMLQMLADTTKEHNEFIMALKQICQTLDSGAKVIPKTKPHYNNFKPNTVDRDIEQQTQTDNTGVEDDVSNQIDTPVAEDTAHTQKVYTGQYKVVSTPNNSAWYVMGLTSNDNEWVPASSAFNSQGAANEYMAKLKKAEAKQKQMVTNKWDKSALAKNNEYRPKEK